MARDNTHFRCLCCGREETCQEDMGAPKEAENTRKATIITSESYGTCQKDAWESKMTGQMEDNREAKVRK